MRNQDASKYLKHVSNAFEGETLCFEGVPLCFESETLCFEDETLFLEDEIYGSRRHLLLRWQTECVFRTPRSLLNMFRMRLRTKLYVSRAYLYASSAKLFVLWTKLYVSM